MVMESKENKVGFFFGGGGIQKSSPQAHVQHVKSFFFQIDNFHDLFCIYIEIILK